MLRLALVGSLLVASPVWADNAAVVDELLPGAERLAEPPVVDWRGDVEADVVEGWRRGGAFLVFTADGELTIGPASWRDNDVMRGHVPPMSLGRAREVFGHPPLPEPPTGWTVRVLADAPESPTRLLATDDGLLVLGRTGEVWRYDHATGAAELLQDDGYPTRRPSLSLHRRQDGMQGIAVSPDGRLYVSANVVDLRPRDGSGGLSTHHATIYRTPAGDLAGTPVPWLEASWPAGIGTYGHGINHMGFDDQGRLYVSSGSRTDANEAGTEADKGTDGEHPLTSAMWRLDASIDEPTVDDIEIYADGLRNTYGWTWLGDPADGRMVGIDSGPNANPPEELNLIEEGGHYGFPHRFADWDVQPYLHNPPAPEGLAMTDPVVNLGPDARGAHGSDISTFEAHSSPLGVADASTLFGPDTLLVARFGNYVMADLHDIGQDVVKVTLLGEDAAGRQTARVETWLDDVGRPIDVAVHGDRVYVVEYHRHRDGPGQNLPGRILVLERE